MDILDADGWSIKDLSAINVVIGKNGCGKSSLLRSIERLKDKIPNVGNVSYMTPERSGSLTYEAHVEQQMIYSSESFLRGNRRNNQFTQFKQQSVAQYRKLESLVSREVEAHIEADKEGKPILFASYLTRLNTLLDEVTVVRKDTAFAIVKKGSATQLDPGSISSGESELISLGIEALAFEKELQEGKTNVLLFDEPDVHLHPDLQVRLMDFIAAQVKARPFVVIIATHSTPILGALGEHDGVSIAFMRSGQKELTFKPISERHKRILPMFGAHPLSNVFNEAPILIVEGEDDERVWQQAVRTSKGRIAVYPCGAETVTEVTNYEREVSDLANAIYDNARAYSLRDGDGKHEELVDEAPVVRLRLQCYAAENLLLSDEVLESLGTTWNAVQTAIEVWLSVNVSHAHFTEMQAFKSSGFDRRDCKLKAIRNDLMSLAGSEKPWEVAVGQTIAGLAPNAQTSFASEGSIYTFLGEKVVKALIPSIMPQAV